MGDIYTNIELFYQIRILIFQKILRNFQAFTDFLDHFHFSNISQILDF